MQRDLLDDLVGKPQRETAGGPTAARFDYQKNWAFCEMLHRHMAKADYLVAFEFHDDVVFLEPGNTPQSAEFVQVKTSSTAQVRKRSTLTSRTKGAPSILGKMCSNFDGICAGHAVKVVLVSNVAFEFGNGDQCAADLDEKHRNAIVEKLTEEWPGFTMAHLDKIHFMVTGVSIEAMQTFLQGEAMNLFQHHFGEDHGLNVMAWLRLVQGEIGRRNNFPSEKISSVSELIALKCIDRKFIGDSLDCVQRGRRSSLNMTLVVAELSAVGWSHTDLMRLDKRLPQVVSDYTNATNLEVAAMAQVVAKEISGGTYVSLGDAVTRIVPLVVEPPGRVVIYDRFYVSALIVLVHHETL